MNRWAAWPISGAALLALYLLFIALPLLGLFVAALGEGTAWRYLSSSTVLAALQLSLGTSVVSMALIVLVGTPAAYFLARHRFAGQWLVNACIELPLVLPPVVAGVGMLLVFGRRGLLGQWLQFAGVAIPFTSLAVIFAQLFVAAPFYLRAAQLGFAAVDQTYEEVSATLGQRPFSTFWRISLPLAMPSLLGGLVLSWARAIAEFGATILFAGNLPGRTQTMPLAILSAMESDINFAIALSVLLVVVSGAFLLAAALLGRRIGTLR